MSPGAREAGCTCPDRCLLHNLGDAPPPDSLRGESVIAPAKRLFTPPQLEELTRHEAAERIATFTGEEKRGVPATKTVGDLANDPPIRTTGMPLSELPKCSLCAKHVGSIFRVVDFRMGVVDQRAARQVAGLSLGFGFPLKLAEVFSSYDDAVRITSDPRIDERAFLCMDCFMGTDLPMLMEKIRQRKESAGGSNRDDVQDAAAGER